MEGYVMKCNICHSTMYKINKCPINTDKDCNIIMKKIYRVWITCAAKHITYIDYKDKTSSRLASFTGGMDGWHCFKYEVIKI